MPSAVWGFVWGRAELGLASGFLGIFRRAEVADLDQLSHGPDGVGVVDAANLVFLAGFAWALVISADYSS